MKCKLGKPEVNYFLASMLVSNNFGRASVDKRTTYVAPDETLYNFATYAGKYLNKLIHEVCDSHKFQFYNY